MTEIQKRLAQIADLIGMPVSSFYEARGIDPSAFTPGTMSQDCLDLVHAYTRIADYEERKRLLKLVQDAAQRP